MEMKIRERMMSKALELDEIYLDLFGTEELSSIFWSQRVKLSITDYNIKQKMQRFSDLQLDRLEILFNLLCEKSTFPEIANNKWIFLLPSHITNYDVFNFRYFDTEDEASDEAFNFIEIPRVAFIGKVFSSNKLTFKN